MEKSYENFFSSIKEAADKFRRWDKSKTIQVVSHLDADGISSCAILTNMLNEENWKYSISILPQLTRETVIELSEKDHDYIIFTDLGSGQISDINEFLDDKEIIVLDHHEPEKEDAGKIIHVNPHVFGIDGSKEISGSGVVYFFTRAIDERNKNMAHIAIVGAIGDVQEDNGFLKLNDELLNDAVDMGLIKVKKSLRFFGMQTRPLYKVLEYTSDPFIPGVSGSESGSIQFLHQLGIEVKDGNKWRKATDLSDEEMQRLIAGVIMKRVGEGNPEDVIGQSYTLPHEKIGSPMRDAREFATLLNACGRMDSASFGIGACLGIESDKRKALETSADYKKKIVESMNWYRDNPDKVFKGDGFMIINAGDNIPATIIGTMASILSKSNELGQGIYILSLARSDAGMTKVSIRISGYGNEDVDLREIIKAVVDKAGGEAGGHKYAAGAFIESAKEDDFIAAAKDIFSEKKNTKI